ncbi:MAG: hypothetical protein WCH37_04885 [Synechococcaceae cyanobacterium ELA182]
MALAVLKHPELVPTVPDLLGELLKVVLSNAKGLGAYGAQL